MKYMQHPKLFNIIRIVDLIRHCVYSHLHIYHTLPFPHPLHSPSPSSYQSPLKPNWAVKRRRNKTVNLVEKSLWEGIQHHHPHSSTHTHTHLSFILLQTRPCIVRLHLPQQDVDGAFINSLSGVLLRCWMIENTHIFEIRRIVELIMQHLKENYVR